MLQIRPEQFDVLAESAKERFLVCVTDELSEGMPASRARPFAEESFSEARGLGLTIRAEVRAWTQLRAHHGPSLATLDWVAPVLADDALRPSEKLAVIDERALMRECRQ